MRVIGRTKPRGVMKVKGGRPGVFGPRSAPSGADPRPAAAVVSTIPKRGHTKRGARDEFSLSRRLPLASWGRGAHFGPSSLLAAALVRGGAQARDLPCDACAQICCWPRRLCLGSRLAGRASGVSLAGVSALVGARRAWFRPPILLCSAWPSARAVGKYHEQTCWDPKDGELCLARMKPEETLVEVRSNSDVQIDCQSWV